MLAYHAEGIFLTNDLFKRYIVRVSSTLTLPPMDMGADLPGLNFRRSIKCLIKNTRPALRHAITVRFPAFRKKCAEECHKMAAMV